MKKIALIICMVVGTLVPITAQGGNGITFETDSFPALLVRAKQENKLVFIDASTAWCKPCKSMEKNIFPQEAAGALFDSLFISKQIDMEKGEGPYLQERYDVQCYPTYLFIDGDGNLVHRFTGAWNLQDFLSHSILATDTYRRYGALEQKFASKTITTDELLAYISMRAKTCLSYDVELSHYLATQNEDALIERRNWNILQSYKIDTRLPLFRHVLSHRNEYEKLYTHDSVATLIKRIYFEAILDCFSGTIKDNEKYESLVNELETLQIPEAEEIILSADLWIYFESADWDHYAKSAALFVEKYVSSDDYMQLNDFAWYFYLNMDAPEHLDLAIGWVEASIKMQQSEFNSDTYAHLLYKRGRYSEALLWARIALAYAEYDGRNAPATENLIQELKTILKKN